MRFPKKPAIHTNHPSTSCAGTSQAFSRVNGSSKTRSAVAHTAAALSKIVTADNSTHAQGITAAAKTAHGTGYVKACPR